MKIFLVFLTQACVLFSVQALTNEQKVHLVHFIVTIDYEGLYNSLIQYGILDKAGNPRTNNIAKEISHVLSPKEIGKIFETCKATVTLEGFEKMYLRNDRGDNSLDGYNPEDEEDYAAGSLTGSATSEESFDTQTVTVPVSICLAIMVGYIFSGAWLFSHYEDWNILDACYFCFISLSTIGFGDIVPGEKIYSSSQGFGVDVSFVLCSMYLMLGMALIAMCFNLMQEEVIHKFRSAVATIKYCFRCGR
ncbi:Ion channel [Popillia japonica]|uniref:Ion channel n=1 Tax=Popillia japonica TaxID=7064 RepID=A0AAW1KQ79_POPJA